MALWHVSMLCSFSGPSNIPHGWATTLFMCRWVLGSRLQVLVWGGGSFLPSTCPGVALLGQVVSLSVPFAGPARLPALEAEWPDQAQQGPSQAGARSASLGWGRGNNRIT